MKIVFFGSGQIGIPSISALADSADIELAHIFTQPARQAGRNRKPSPTPVTAWAMENSIPFTEAENINSPDMIEKVSACNADLLVVIAFGQKIGNEVIALFEKGAVNVHASLLPKYRGAAPVNWAVINNETETGVSIITLAERMDAGEVLAQVAIPIAQDDTAQTVHDKLAQLAPKVLLRTIAEIDAGTAVYKDQDDSKVTFAPKLKKSDGLLDFSEPAGSIVAKIRGLSPWPGAQADYFSQKTSKTCRITIAKAAVITAHTQPEKIGCLDGDLNIVCGQDKLKILQLKPAGGKLMDFQDFANGRQTAPGDKFLKIQEDV
jgi:methionyl-tRNA formyltransferase